MQTLHAAGFQLSLNGQQFHNASAVAFTRYASPHVASISPGLVVSDFYAAKNGQAASDLVYAAADALEARDVVDAALYILTAPPHVEIADVLLRCTNSLR